MRKHPMFCKGAQAIGGAHYGQGNESLRVSNVQCTGIEPSLSSCVYETAESCAHYQDAGVLCAEDLTLCNHSSVRLVTGNTLNDGLIQVCIEGKWYFACNEDWSTEEASVVCSQSGFIGEGTNSIVCVIASAKRIFTPPLQEPRLLILTSSHLQLTMEQHVPSSLTAVGMSLHSWNVCTRSNQTAQQTPCQSAWSVRYPVKMVT